MTRYAFARLLPLLCAGCVLTPAATLAGSVIEAPYFVNGARDYAPSYWPQTSPYYYPAARPQKQNLHLYLNGQGNTVRVLDGGKQIVVYDRECRIHQEMVPSARGPHRITVTRC
jgi:hypothetical protein